EEERVVWQLEDSDVPRVVAGAEADPAGLEALDVPAVEAVGAVVALDAALGAHDLADQRAGLVADLALVAGKRALERDDDELALRPVLLVRRVSDPGQVAG